MSRSKMVFDSLKDKEWQVNKFSRASEGEIWRFEKKILLLHKSVL